MNKFGFSYECWQQLVCYLKSYRTFCLFKWKFWQNFLCFVNYGNNQIMNMNDKIDNIHVTYIQQVADLTKFRMCKIVPTSSLQFMVCVKQIATSQNQVTNHLRTQLKDKPIQSFQVCPKYIQNMHLCELHFCPKQVQKETLHLLSLAAHALFWPHSRITAMHYHLTISSFGCFNAIELVNNFLWLDPSCLKHAQACLHGIFPTHEHSIFSTFTSYALHCCLSIITEDRVGREEATVEIYEVATGKIK